MSAEKVFLKGNMAKAAKMYNDNEAEISGGGITDMVSRFLEKTVNPYLSKQLKQQYADKAKAKDAPKATPAKVVPVKSKLHPSAKRVPSGNVGIATQQSPDEGPSISSGVRDEPLPKSRPKGPPPSFTKAADATIKDLETANVPEAVATTISTLGADIDAIKDLDGMPKLDVKETEQPEPMGEKAVARKGRKGKQSAVPPEDVGDSLLANPPIQPFVNRIGTKKDLANWLVSHFSKEAKNIYVEPFIGGGAVYLAKRKSAKEAINDFNPQIADSWKRLKTTTPQKFEEEFFNNEEANKWTRAYCLWKLKKDKEYTKAGKQSTDLRPFITHQINRDQSNQTKLYLKGTNWKSYLNSNGTLKYDKSPKNDKGEKVAADDKYEETIKDPKGKKEDKKTTVWKYYKQLSDNKVIKAKDIAEAKILYGLSRAPDNRKTYEMGGDDIGVITAGSLTGGNRKVELLTEKLSKETGLPKISNSHPFRSWLQNAMRPVKNPEFSDSADAKPNKDDNMETILEGKTTVADLLFAKWRSAMGYGAGASLEWEPLMKMYYDKSAGKGEADNKAKKISVALTLTNLLEPTGTLNTFNERMKDTSVSQGDYYDLLNNKTYNTADSFYFLDPPYQASGEYGNPDAFVFEAFVKAVNGLADNQYKKGSKPAPRKAFNQLAKIFITINGGDDFMKLFQKYARQTGNEWYALKVYVVQKQQNNKTGKTGWRYEIFYANYKFHDKATNILSDDFKPDAKGDIGNEGAVAINSSIPNGMADWKTFFVASKMEDQWDKRNAEGSISKKANQAYSRAGETETTAAPAVPVNEIVEAAPAKKPRKPRAKKEPVPVAAPAVAAEEGVIQGSGFLNDDLDVAEGLIGGYYSPNRPPHLGSKYAFTPSVGYGGSEYNTFDY